MYCVANKLELSGPDFDLVGLGFELVLELELEPEPEPEPEPAHELELELERAEPVFAARVVNTVETVAGIVAIERDLELFLLAGD
jgi:hypothetical protein